MGVTALRKKTASAAPSIEDRVAALDWTRITEDLNAHGAAVTGPLLSSRECEALIQLYPAPHLFRSRVVMQRHGFGRGEYQYFAYPLPEAVTRLRESLYARLAEVANGWHAASRPGIRNRADRPAPPGPRPHQEGRPAAFSGVYV
jgi:hypothetical protein